jgi:acyl carrier protein
MKAVARLAPQEVEAQTLEIVRALLRELGSHQAADKASPESSFERELGLGSLERVELLVRCESRFGVRLPDEIAQQGETVAEWVRAIVDGGAAVAVRTRYRITPPDRHAPPEPATASTLIEVLRRHAEIEPNRVHIHLPEDETGQDITYGELLDVASAVAAALRAKGLRRDETVAIMLPTCADFFYAFFGVLLAGGIAVPIYPPARPDKIEEYVQRQVRILQNAQVRFLITFGRVKAVSHLMGVNLPSLLEVTTVEGLRQAGKGVPLRSADTSETGFIQYTSGSTGDPKGVTLSHANILANVRGIGWAVKVRPTDVVVTWLPLYHDMGLIGSWLFALYWATPITVLSPLAFLSRPERWLWAMHDARGTLCPAPNFSYELCARKIPDRAIEGLDLSSWRVAINAGEAVLPDTLARFCERFAKYGFRPEAFMPCYGLAESSVALSMPPVDRGAVVDAIRREPFEKEGRAEPADEGEANRLRFVGAGLPLPDHEIQIRDAGGCVLGERVQGKVWFRGPSRTSGYYRNPQATAAVLDAGGWMDSGDLGYWAGGEIFITGRLKDLIIKGGRNIVPQEVEEAASNVQGVRRGCVASFGAPDPASGTERLVVVAETRITARQELDRLEADIVRAIEAAVGIPPDVVRVVSPQVVPKTSSGKVRRQETRSLFLSGKLDARKRAPWLQLVRLALGNAGSWAALAARRAGRLVRQWWDEALLLALCAAVRVVPARSAVWRLARAYLWLSRHDVEVQGALRGPAVLVSNRAGRLDPVVVAAAVRGPVWFADPAALAGLPRSSADLLRRLVAAPLYGPRAKHAIRRVLQKDGIVVVFPESAIGEAPRRSRFRLDAIHAAVDTASPLYPAAITGTEHILESARHPALRKKVKVVIGEPVWSRGRDVREIARLREDLRSRIADLS